MTAETPEHGTAERAEMKRGEQGWDNEGGRRQWRAPRIVHVANSELAYHVMVGRTVKACFATMRDAENFVRRTGSGSAPSLSALYDRPKDA